MNEENTTDVSDIKLIPIAKLLKGTDHFFVPDYQRGYRWTSEQVEKLLEDLLLFAIVEQGNRGAYYCLQPLVVRKDRTRCEVVDGQQRVTTIWEVIDGQQRLTTIKILLHHLKTRIGEDAWAELKIKPFDIEYASRKRTTGFIQSLRPDGCSHEPNEPIDFFYMKNAYRTIIDWFSGTGPYQGEGAPALCERMGEVRNSADDFFKKLLFLEGDKHPTAQFMWYEADGEERGLNLFNRLNTGKLELTDAELVKGLFLLKSNFRDRDAARREQEQYRRSVKWEQWENTLHDDAFWRFLTNRNDNRPNRIDLLLNLIYQLHKDSKVSQFQNAGVRAVPNRNHVVFDYYNDIFLHELSERRMDTGGDVAGDEKKGGILQSAWEEIENTFRVLEDWFSDPTIYNIVGYLCQTGTAELVDLFKLYRKCKSEGKTRADFISNYVEKPDGEDGPQKHLDLKGRIKDALAAIRVTRKERKKADTGGASPDYDYTIQLEYKNRATVFNLLLLLNIEHLNRRAAEDLKPGERDLCKFPFSALADVWHIEHVDSRTTNPLTKSEDIKEWIDTSLKDLDSILRTEQREYINRIQNSDAPDKNQLLIQYLKGEVAKEDEEDPDKDNISNLVLLDAHTNESYKNALFVTKRRKIIERREGGQFVPETTSYVFFKLMEGSAHSRWRWEKSDRQCYANYIARQLAEYLAEPADITNE